MAMSTQELQRAMEQGQRLHSAGRFADAEAAYRKILAQDPRQVAAIHLLGLLLLQQGKPSEGIQLMAQSVQMAPDNAVMCFNYGSALMQCGDSAGAVAQFRRALELQPNYPDAMNNLSVALSKTNQFEDAAVVARLALAQRPNSPESARNLSQALRGQGDQAMYEREPLKAAEAFRQSLNVNGGNFPAHLGLGSAYAALGDARAEQHFREAARLKKDSHDACLAMAHWLDRASRREEAAQWFERTVALKPDLAEAWGDLAAVCAEMGRVDQAIAHARRARELAPDNHAIAATLGAALSSAGRNHEAAEVLLDALGRARAHEAEHPGEEAFGPEQRTVLAAVLSNLFLLRHYEADYDPERLAREQREFGRIVDRHPAGELAQRFDLSPRPKLRIGYVSGDFRRHAVASFIESILANHNRERFEIYCYSNWADADEVTERLKGYADQWEPIVNVPDAQVAERIERDRIDILVDLSGHTGGNRLPVFGLKPAPVQATYLGFPGSTGLAAMDYRISDAFADPPGVTEAYHQEKLIRLPHGFYCYRPHDDAPEVSPSPAQERGCVTFASLNVFRKVTDETMELWARILAGAPQSRLVMITHAEEDRRVRKIFAAAGVEPERLELVQRGRLVGYYQRLAKVDIQLDTYPYNGHTTTCDCIWMGIPVVTLAGKTSVSRSGVSVLSNVGHPEWIARTPEEYVRIATDLARDVPRLAQLRQTLRDEMARSPITDAQQITRELERAYETMWETCVNTRS
jgi:predicted O-linked N-acetylglucosamine transferase (SPINDLY family)